MPVGDNQLNLAIFETGYKKRIGALLPADVIETTHTTGVHPMLVYPRIIRYEDTSRSPVTQTSGSSLYDVSGRALRRVFMEGSWGVENRGLLLYLGVGEVRFQRFYKEVVRFSDAIRDDDIDAVTDILNGTPLISILYKLFDEEDSVPFVNFYDFWHDITFQCQVQSFRFWREHRRGAAEGLIHYQMQLQEVGPLVTGSLATTIINTILEGLTAWDAINNVVESYTMGNIIESFVNVAAPVRSEINDSVEAAQAQIDSINKLMGGAGTSQAGTGAAGGATSTEGTSTSTTTTSATAKNQSTGSSDLATLEAQQGLANTFQELETTADELATVADDLAANLESYESETGKIDWEKVLAEGGSQSLFIYDELAALLDLEDALRIQKVMGVFFGMSREEFQTYIEAGGSTSQSAPEIGGSITHVVRDTDTPNTLEKEFGVSWPRVLSLNRMTPDEALFPGNTIQIPRIRPRGPQGIEGLPTFGSHVGEDAWGVDLNAELTGDDNGDPRLVSGADILKQGCEYQVDMFADYLIDTANRFPESVRTSYLAKQLAVIFTADQRIAGISDINIAEIDSGLDVQVTLQAINGAVVRTGG